MGVEEWYRQRSGREENPEWLEQAYSAAAELVAADDPEKRVGIKRSALEDIFEAAGADYEHIEGNSRVFFQYNGKMGKVDGARFSSDLTALVMDSVEIGDLLEPFQQPTYGVPSPDQVEDSLIDIVKTAETIEHHYGKDYVVVDRSILDRESSDNNFRKQKPPVEPGPHSREKVSDLPYSIDEDEMNRMVEKTDLELIEVEGHNLIENVGRVLEYIDTDLDADVSDESLVPQVALGRNSGHFPETST